MPPVAAPCAENDAVAASRSCSNPSARRSTGTEQASSGRARPRVSILPTTSVAATLRSTHVRFGSFTTGAFSTRADQCPLLLQQRHCCSAWQSDAKGRFCCESRR
jgi:hypothetical protein